MPRWYDAGGTVERGRHRGSARGGGDAEDRPPGPPASGSSLREPRNRSHHEDGRARRWRSAGRSVLIHHHHRRRRPRMVIPASRGFSDAMSRSASSTRGGPTSRMSPVSSSRGSCMPPMRPAPGGRRRGRGRTRGSGKGDDGCLSRSAESCRCAIPSPETEWTVWPSRARVRGRPYGRAVRPFEGAGGGAASRRPTPRRPVQKGQTPGSSAWMKGLVTDAGTSTYMT